jgi:hypothetical protein
MAGQVPAIGSVCGYLEEAALWNKRRGACEPTSSLVQEPPGLPEALLPEPGLPE